MVQVTSSPTPNPTPPREYAVFISYKQVDNRQLDRQWANWLHYALETYEVPPELVGKINSRGEPIPSSLYPVFRDEEELPANADLTANIRLALEQSRTLIVICSPRAVQSRFVVDEIRYFKELGKAGQILALLIAGEPNTSDDSAKQNAGFGVELECLPMPLRYGVPRGDNTIDWEARTEPPIAADVRPEGLPVEGYTAAAAYRTALVKDARLSHVDLEEAVLAFEHRKEQAVLKLVAGALGIRLGELTQRDKRYRLARAQARAKLFRRIAIGFAVLALAAAGGGISAWQQRDEATRQRTLAEQRREKAEAARQDAERLIDFLQHDARTVLSNVGRLDLMEGINRQIAEYYQHNSSDGGQAAQQHYLADLKFEQAKVYQDLGKLTEAREGMTEARGLAKQAVVQTEKQEWLALLGSINVALVQLSLLPGGDAAQALSYCDETMKIVEVLRRKQPDSAVALQMWTAVGGLKARILAAKGDAPQAIKELQVIADSLEIHLNKGEVSIETAHGYLTTIEEICTIQRTSGQLREALVTAKKVEKIAQTVAASGHFTPPHLESRIRADCILADVYRDLGDFVLARQGYAKAANEVDELIELDSRNSGWLQLGIYCTTELGNQCVRLGDVSAAAYFAQQLRYADLFQRADLTDPEGQLLVARACRNLAITLLANPTKTATASSAKPREIVQRGNDSIEQYLQRVPGSTEATKLAGELAELKIAAQR
jgi:tetratricopeptide (TPR) repeat protein